MSSAKKDIIENIVGLVVVVIILIVVFYFFDFEYIKNQIELAGVWGPIFLIIAKASTLVFAPLSGSPLYILAGALFGFGPGLIYIILGDILGSSIAFFISRSFGQKIVQKMLQTKNMKTTEKIIRIAESTKGFFIARICFAAMPEIVAYAAGLTKIKFARFFLIYNFVGIIPSAILVYGGNVLVSNLDPKFWALLILVGTLAVVAGLWLFFKYFKSIK